MYVLQFTRHGEQLLPQIISFVVNRTPSGQEEGRRNSTCRVDQIRGTMVHSALPKRDGPQQEGKSSSGPLPLSQEHE